MSEQPKETLSALMDNESSDFELRRMLDRVAEDAELGHCWRRYHITRSALKQEDLGNQADISSRVMAALDNEAPLHLDTQPESKTSAVKNYFLKPFASMAVAASVTAMVILGAQNVGVGQTDVVPATTAQVSSTLVPAVTPSQNFMRAQFGSSPILTSPQGEADIIRLNKGLNQYIQQHQTLLSRESTSARLGWLPDGYRPLRNAVTPGADLTVFTNGKNSFTVCVEPVANQIVPEGVTRAGDIVAVGKRVNDRFITVVGDVPLMVADRIASSITTN
ncbi:MAG: MucB/RseB C-terminal domain-containing protein [Amphritea sp.]